MIKHSNPDISIIILTLNEERHIGRCLNSLNFSKKIYIVDSFSSDKTLDLAQHYGAIITKNQWINYATQFNWGLNNLAIDTEWVMRMDADEYVTPELAAEIIARLPKLDPSITGIYLTRRVKFMGRWITHGGHYPIHLLRIWRRGLGKCEERWMDEHIQLTNGRTVLLQGDIVDENLNNITWWTTKHNGYATREAIDLLNVKYKFSSYDGLDINDKSLQEKRKRWLKEVLYAKLPLGFRALAFFLYRYIFRLGFLDGKQGLIYHFLQGFWYRFLVDVKVLEIERRMKAENIDARTAIEREYGIHV